MCDGKADPPAKPIVPNPLVLAMLASTAGTRAQLKYPSETQNAALRYWIAFAEMQDAPADKAIRELLEKTVIGGTAWRESALGPILDANAEAIRTMQQATKLPECDWGFEYSRGPRAPATFFLQARELARLNTLTGMRQMARGDSQAAVNTWLAGIHFSQDLARGGPLIFTLVAMRMMLPNLRALNEGTSKGQLSEAQKKEVYAAVNAQPEDGLDWRGAWGLEYETGEQFLEKLRTSTNPPAGYEEMGMPVPKQGIPPTMQEIQGFREYMLAVQAALREPPGKAKALLDDLEPKRLACGEVEQNLIPSALQINAARIELITARTELMQTFSPK
jgi:hypothetical protein